MAVKTDTTNSEDYAIEVNDVTMIFNMASERLDNLKEYFIKLVKHELFFEEFHALKHVSFKVRRGEVLGLVGTNGSGKSTMLKIIAGVLEPSEGSVRVHGNIAPLIELGAGFDIELTARENIYLNGALLGYTKEFIDAHLDDIVDFAELRDFMDMPLKNYSSGMVARIAFAIATVVEPDVLIVDETLSVGDVFFQEKCERRIREFIESGRVNRVVREPLARAGGAPVHALRLDREGRAAHDRRHRRRPPRPTAGSSTNGRREWRCASPARKRSVAAVVVTYNRKELLLECLDCLAAQDLGGLGDAYELSVIVVDNASTDGTQEALAALAESGKVAYFNTGENLGGAGGFNFGMRVAVEAGHDFVWVMDDDCMAHSDTLRELLLAGEGLDGDYGYLTSVCLWTDGKPCTMNRQRHPLHTTIEDFTPELQPCTLASFVSLFVPADVVAELGASHQGLLHLDG